VSVPAQRLSASQAYRMSVDSCVFEQAHDTPLDADAWYDGSSAGGSVSHDAATSTHQVNVNTASGARGLLRSHARLKAAVGKSRSTTIVGHVSAAVSAQAKRWGLFDDNNGHFFELDGEELRAVLRSNVTGVVVDTPVALPNWRDAAGTVKNTSVDCTKTHVWEIREVWPAGDVAFFVDGEQRCVISAKGVGIGPASRTSRLPVSIECVNTGVTLSGSFRVVATKVDVEQRARADRAGSRSVANAAVGTSDTALLAIRTIATLGGVLTLGEVLADLLTATCSAVATLKVFVSTAEAPLTVTGGAWASASTPSIAEVNVTPASFSGGEALEFVVDDDGLSISDLSEAVRALRIRGDGTTQDTIVVALAAATGTVSARVALTWKEIR
jgi:hypothetical protein